MTIIKGKWLFNNAVTPLTWLNEYQIENVIFTSNGERFTDIYWNSIPDSNDDVYHIYYADTLAVRGYYGNISSWENEAFKTIEFEGEQEVSDEFYAWMTANATQQVASSTGKKFTKLSIGDIVKTVGSKVFRKLSTIILPRLKAPSVDIDGATLKIYDTEGLATSYDVLADGDVITTVPSVLTDADMVTITIYDYDGSNVLARCSSPERAIVQAKDNYVEIMASTGGITRYDYDKDGLFLAIHSSPNGYYSDYSWKGRMEKGISRLFTESADIYLHLKVKPASISISDNLLYINVADTTSQGFKIYADGVLKSTVSKTGDTTIVDTSIMELTPGTWPITVEAIAEGHDDSDTSNTAELYVAPPAGSKSLTVNCTGYSGSADYWTDRDKSGASDGVVYDDNQIIGIMSHVYLQGSWCSYAISYSSATNCSIEYYDYNGNVVTSGYAYYAKVYDIVDNASVTVYDMD